MEKAKLRKEIKEKRKALTADEVRYASEIICNSLWDMDAFIESKTVMVYLSSFNEVSTMAITKKLLSLGKRVVVPISDTSTETLILSYIEDMSSLSKGAYGVLEPTSIKNANASDIECVLVPGIAFDVRGNRMGFGKGYYDKLLAQTSAVKIGLCYDFQLVDNIAVEAHDVPMDIIITEKQILQFDRSVLGGK